MDKILVFIPMYNCSKQITRVIKQFDREVSEYVSEIILINNRSTDNTELVASKFLSNSNIKIPTSVLRNKENYGLGGSHKVAWEYAIKNNFDYVITLHGDDQGNINNLIPYLRKKIYKKYDCMLGSRFCKKSKLEGYSLFRTFGNIVYNKIFSIMLKMKVYDLGSGLNMYDVKMLKDRHYYKFKDNLTFNYYGILALKYYNHKYKFFPITWREDDQVSNVKMVSQAFKTLVMLLKFVLNKKLFMSKEHRDKIYSSYDADIIYKK